MTQDRMDQFFNSRPPTGDLSVYYQHVGGSKVQGEIVVVPEPSAIGLGGMATAALFAFAWRKRLA